jgi:hypothetical protein
MLQNFKNVSRFFKVPIRIFELKFDSLILPPCHDMFLFTFLARYYGIGGPSSVVGIATGYSLDGPEIDYRLWAKFWQPA